MTSRAREVFVDSVFWIALLLPGDQWRNHAIEARNSLDDGARFVTTTDVLSELLAAASRGGPDVRRGAARMAREVMSDSRTLVLPQSSDMFEQGLALYESRADKRYSLTDCISMSVMRERGITEVLTRDRDFESEGFIRLIS